MQDDTPAIVITPARFATQQNTPSITMTEGGETILGQAAKNRKKQTPPSPTIEVNTTSSRPSTKNGKASGSGDDVQPSVEKRPGTVDGGELNNVMSPMSPRLVAQTPWSRKNTSLDLGDYFAGPRDMKKHSKWPLFLRMHGSILPKMIVPLIFVAGWATAITCVHKLVDGVELNVSSILLTVTGFVVGLGLSFRSSTAYERYAEGRKFWTALVLCCNNIGRGIWVHAKEREGQVKDDILAKMTALNLLVAFSVALKHKLRWEPYTQYDDLAGLVGHLDVFAKAATEEDPSAALRHKPNFFKATGQYLGISFAASNPRKALKNATKPLGNLPLEILTFLAAYVDELAEDGLLPVGMTQTLLYNSIAMMNDILTGCDRVATTPLPIAYQIAFHQITWVYVLLLPFQLLESLDWVTIPAAIAASYIILGILFIGNEIEDPFGQDVNDLPMDEYCAHIATELDIIASRPRCSPSKWIRDPRNKPFFPLSSSGYNVWAARSEGKVRAAIKQKTELGLDDRRRRQGTEETMIGDDRV
ncbi:hypothetical protein MKZ38_009231 [Zalerion maritima]|uniref:Uncharacterized protein n=1 Tax=Zalerion maritima TaxID=339359 RepID=A0AAD5WUT2_9PEZI|nr:hypothetical protein MKZ38_009231 [Zalerion maritima]